MGSVCDVCGRPVEFRTIRGVVRPMGCSCHSPNPQTNMSESTDFVSHCRCPVCHTSVYFIRHNGGSVWLDELGSPWPKHHCFNQRKEQQQSLDWAFTKIQSMGQSNAFLGLVLPSNFVKNEYRIQISKPLRLTISVKLKSMLIVKPGDLVVVQKFYSPKKKLDLYLIDSSQNRLKCIDHLITDY